MISEADHSFFIQGQVKAPFNCREEKNTQKLESTSVGMLLVWHLLFSRVKGSVHLGRDFSRVRQDLGSPGHPVPHL